MTCSMGVYIFFHFNVQARTLQNLRHYYFSFFFREFINIGNVLFVLLHREILDFQACPDVKVLGYGVCECVNIFPVTVAV